MKLFSAATLLPIAGRPIPEGAIAVEDGKIVEVGARKNLLKKYCDTIEEEFDHAVLMPGLVNTDTHLEYLSFQGSGREPNFIDWTLETLDYRFAAQPAERRRNATEGVQKLLHAGTVTAADSGRYVGSLASFQAAPLKLHLFPEILTSAEGEVMDDYQSSLNLVDEIRALRSPRLGAGLHPYAAYTLSRHLLKVVASQAREWGIPLKIHAAESFAEMQLFHEATGEIAERLFPRLGWEEASPPLHRKTPIEFLDSIGFLEAAPIVVGGLHLGENDLAILARRNCKVVWRPRTEAHLKLGSLPYQKLKKAKVPVGLGTDGIGSRFSLSLWDEMRTVGEVLPPEELLEIATIGGARVLGCDGEIGSLEAGKRADLIAVKIPARLKTGEIAQHLVCETTEREILAVFVDGQKIIA